MNGEAVIPVALLGVEVVNLFMPPLHSVSDKELTPQQCAAIRRGEIIGVTLALGIAAIVGKMVTANGWIVFGGTAAVLAIYLAEYERVLAGAN